MCEKLPNWFHTLHGQWRKEAMQRYTIKYVIPLFRIVLRIDNYLIIAFSCMLAISVWLETQHGTQTRLERQKHIMFDPIQLSMPVQDIVIDCRSLWAEYGIPFAN